MIETLIIEAHVNNLGKIEERELGWCMMPEVPVEKKPPPQPKPVVFGGEPELPPMPLTVKVNDETYFIIGHSWDIKTSPKLDEASPPTLMLIVQKVEIKASGTLVRAGAETLGQLDRISKKRN